MAHQLKIAHDEQLLCPAQKRRKRNKFWSEAIQIDRDDGLTLGQGLFKRRLRTISQYSLLELQRVMDLAG